MNVNRLRINARSGAMLNMNTVTQSSEKNAATVAIVVTT
jgi:hypothetical protein